MPNYRVPVLEEFEFQPPVLDKDLATPPGSPNKGDRYIVAGSATDDWVGHEGDISYYGDSDWQFDTPNEGTIVWVSDEDEFYVFDGTSWGEYVGEPGISGEPGEPGEQGPPGPGATYDLDYDCLIIESS